MKQQLSETYRMQQLAGLINENQHLGILSEAEEQEVKLGYCLILPFEGIYRTLPLTKLQDKEMGEGLAKSAVSFIQKKRDEGMKDAQIYDELKKSYSPYI
jgi:hypothetical protein